MPSPAVATVEVVETAPNRLTVTGALTFATARRAYEAGVRTIRAAPAGRIEVDCSGVTQSDSAGLAVLINWLACALSRDLGIRFANLPDAIRAVARISEVESILDEGTGA